MTIWAVIFLIWAIFATILAVAFFFGALFKSASADAFAWSLARLQKKYDALIEDDEEDNVIDLLGDMVNEYRLLANELETVKKRLNEAYKDYDCQVDRYVRLLNDVGVLKTDNYNLRQFLDIVDRVSAVYHDFEYEAEEEDNAETD